MYQDLQSEQQGLASPGGQSNNGGYPAMGAIPTGKLFNGIPKRTLVKYVWMSNTALIFPYFVSACACAGGEFPGGEVFTMLFITLIACVVSVMGYFLMLKPQHQTEMNYGAFLTSQFFMSAWMLNSGIDAGSFNNKFYVLMGVNVDAVRSVIAFSTFLFLGYLASFLMFFLWRDDLGYCGKAGSEGEGGIYKENPSFQSNSQQPSVPPPDVSAPDYSNVDL